MLPRATEGSNSKHPLDFPESNPGPIDCLLWTAPSRQSGMLFEVVQRSIEGIVEFRRLTPDVHTPASPVLDFSGALSSDSADEIWRFESTRGQPLCRNFALSANWHRPPFVVPVRLVRYGRVWPDGEIIGEAIIGTRRSYRALLYHQARIAGVLVHQALSHGCNPMAWPTTTEAPLRDSLYALVTGAARWIWGMGSAALFSDIWRIGIVHSPIAVVALAAQGLPVSWIRSPSHDASYADPFRWPETGEILCEEYSFKTSERTYRRPSSR